MGGCKHRSEFWWPLVLTSVMALIEAYMGEITRIKARLNFFWANPSRNIRRPWLNPYGFHFGSPFCEPDVSDLMWPFEKHWAFTDSTCSFYVVVSVVSFSYYELFMMLVSKISLNRLAGIKTKGFRLRLHWSAFSLTVGPVHMQQWDAVWAWH